MDLRVYFRINIVYYLTSSKKVAQTKPMHDHDPIRTGPALAVLRKRQKLTLNEVATRTKHASGSVWRLE